MITTRDSIQTTISRSGHAACWCPPLDGIVQFGGWPPSALLESVITTEGFHCPLYFMDANDITHVLEEKRSQEREEHADAMMYSLLPSRLGPQEALEDAKLRALRSALHEVLDGCRESTLNSSSENDLDISSTNALSGSSSVSPCGRTYMDAAPMGDEFALEDKPFRRHAAEHLAKKVNGSHPDMGTDCHVDPMDSHGAGNRNFLFPLHDLPVDRRFPMDEEESFLSSNSFTSSVSYQSGINARMMHSSAARGAAACETEITDGVRWKILPCRSSPRSRHGHQLVYSGFRIFIIGGSYWALGNRMASSDMVYHIPSQTWEQVPSLLPPRFCAAVALSPLTVPGSGENVDENDGERIGNQESDTPGSAQQNQKGSAPMLTGERQDVHHIASVSHQAPLVVYSFGGTDSNHAVTNTLSRVWLPSGQSEEDVPQYGSIPPPQFKGVLVCDISREITASERQQGAFPVGRLFYCDGFREGRAVRPSLWIFDVHTCIWRRIGSAPDLVRAQVVVWRSPPHNQTIYDLHSPESSPQSSRGGAVERIDVFGGMPSKRGSQRRSAESHSLNCSSNKWDRVCTAVPRGLTAHCVVTVPEHHVLHDLYGIAAICCGGNEDNPEDEGEQNGLGEPISYLHLLSYRMLSLQESCRYALSHFPVPQKSIVGEKDAVLDELF